MADVSSTGSAFARSDLPVLPADWRWVQFSETCDRVSVGHVGPTTEFFTTAPDGIRFLRSQNVRPGKLELENALSITPDFHKKLKKSQLRPGDILFVRVGANRGDCCVVPNGVGELNCANIVFARPKQPTGFHAYFFQSELGQSLLLSASVGAAQGVINTGSVATMPVPLPPLPIQRRIAGILSAYDDLIENSQRRIKILESMARALYREWFVEFRFPGSANEKLVDLETGPAPARWLTGRLDNFLDVIETGNRPKGGVGEITEGVPSIGAESIVGIGQFDFSKTKFVPRAYFESMRSGVVQDRDVLVYKDGGRPGIFIPHITLFGSGFPFEEMAINSHVYRVRAGHGISQEYLYFYLSSEAVLHWMHLHGSGAAIPSIAREDLKRLPFVQPDTGTLQKFDAVVQPLVAQILSLARQTQNLRRTRDLLLPRLLSGQIEVEAA